MGGGEVRVRANVKARLQNFDVDAMGVVGWDCTVTDFKMNGGRGNEHPFFKSWGNNSFFTASRSRQITCKITDLDTLYHAPEAVQKAILVKANSELRSDLGAANQTGLIFEYTDYGSARMMMRWNTLVEENGDYYYFRFIDMGFGGTIEPNLTKTTVFDSKGVEQKEHEVSTAVLLKALMSYESALRAAGLAE
jgi:hypothetical protein